MSSLNITEIINSLSEEELCKYCKYNTCSDCKGSLILDGAGNLIYPTCASRMHEDYFALDAYLKDMGKLNENKRFA